MEEENGEVDDWEVYQKVIDEYSHGSCHGRALGLGAGVKFKDKRHLPTQTCNKPACLELKGEVEFLKNKLENLTQVVQSLLPRSSDNSKCARNSHYVVRLLPSNIFFIFYGVVVYALIVCCAFAFFILDCEL